MAIGELGLNGEVRAVSNLDARIKEALRMGFKRIVIPKTSKMLKAGGAELIPVHKLERALESIY